jgi:hypothetical protein
MAKNKMQMVEDDQIENVGIMSGFMDDLDEMMGEIDDDMDDGGDDDESDMANMLGRRPDSPEILMNNLRGDYRSIDARREELADLVGYNAAAETPDAVLAMLQPVLAKQGVAGLPMGNADVGSLPMDPLTGMPPQGGQPPMDPAMAGMPPALAPAAPQGIESLPMEQPLKMARGGIVQYFQEGNGPEAPGGVTPMDLPPDIAAQLSAIARQRLLDPVRAADIPDVGARTRELAPMYAEILGTQDKDAMRSQMLFDIAKAALGFAGNVGPQGQPLRGSFGTRLAAAASELPAQIGARSAAAQTAETQARLAALQQAQGEVTAAQQTNLQREKDYNELLMKGVSQKLPPQLLTPEQIKSLGLQEGLPWQLGSEGYSIAGGRPAAPLVDMGENTLEKVTATTMAEGVLGEYNQARAATSNIRKIDETIKLLNEGNVDTGFGAEFRQNVRRVQELFADDPERVNTLSDTELLNSALGTEVFGAISALGVGARGLDTPAEREFLREVVAGRLGLTKDTLLEMARVRRRAEENNIRMWNETLSSGRADPVIRTSQGMLPNQPLTVPPDPIAAASGDDQDRAARVRQLLGRQ